MKIGFDAKRLFCNTTGLGNYSRSLVHNLQHFYPEQRYHLFSPEARRLANTEIFFDSDKFHIHESTARLKAYWRSFSIVNDLKKSGIDLYHGLSNELPHKLQQSGIKSVVTIHDLIFKTNPETYSLSERLVYDKKFKYACHQADKIVAISENTKEDIIRFYGIEPENIEVIYQVCNPIFYQLRSQAENESVRQQYHLPDRYFLYVGSVEARKNVKLIIKAYQQLEQKDIIPLVIVGKGGRYKEEVKTMISQYQLTQHIVWLENLSHNLHLQSIYQMAKAVIYPSFYEGFGLPIAEALLSQTAVIAANTSSLQEAGGKNSIYINPNNATELAEAMSNILNDEQLVNKMKLAGYEYALQHFDTRKKTEEMFALYKSLLA